VYNTHFRCNGARLIEYPNLLRFTKDLFEQPGVAATFALDEIKRHYYTTHDDLNPKRIIAAGPLDLGFT
jgi:putative glutathione S-transferase